MGEALKALRDFAAQAAEYAELPRPKVEGLRLAVDEYATNIITYGYRDSGLRGEIEASANINDDHLIISLIDTAAAFDPTKVRDPDNLNDPLDTRPIGGLGLMLVRQNVDEWRYERIGNRNYNHFFLKRK